MFVLAFCRCRESKHVLFSLPLSVCVLFFFCLLWVCVYVFFFVLLILSVGGGSPVYIAVAPISERLRPSLSLLALTCDDYCVALAVYCCTVCDWRWGSDAFGVCDNAPAYLGASLLALSRLLFRLFCFAMSRFLFWAAHLLLALFLGDLGDGTGMVCRFAAASARCMFFFVYV